MIQLRYILCFLLSCLNIYAFGLQGKIESGETLPRAIGPNCTLIDPNWVITTATIGKPKSIIIAGKTIQIDRWVKYAGWDFNIYGDIQLLHLAEPIYNIAPIKRVHAPLPSFEKLKIVDGNRESIMDNLNLDDPKFLVQDIQSESFKISLKTRPLLIKFESKDNSLDRKDTGSGIFIVKDGEHHLAFVYTGFRNTSQDINQPVKEYDFININNTHLQNWINKIILADAVQMKIGSLEIDKSIKSNKMPDSLILNGDFKAILIDPQWAITSSNTPINQNQKLDFRYMSYNVDARYLHPLFQNDSGPNLQLLYSSEPVKNRKPFQRARLTPTGNQDKQYIAQTIENGFNSRKVYALKMISYYDDLLENPLMFNEQRYGLSGIGLGNGLFLNSDYRINNSFDVNKLKLVAIVDHLWTGQWLFEALNGWVDKTILSLALKPLIKREESLSEENKASEFENSSDIKIFFGDQEKLKSDFNVFIYAVTNKIDEINDLKSKIEQLSIAEQYKGPRKIRVILHCAYPTDKNSQFITTQDIIWDNYQEKSLHQEKTSVHDSLSLKPNGEMNDFIRNAALYPSKHNILLMWSPGKSWEYAHYYSDNYFDESLIFKNIGNLINQHKLQLDIARFDTGYSNTLENILSMSKEYKNNRNNQDILYSLLSYFIGTQEPVPQSQILYGYKEFLQNLAQLKDFNGETLKEIIDLIINIKTGYLDNTASVFNQNYREGSAINYLINQFEEGLNVLMARLQLNSFNRDNLFYYSNKEDNLVDLYQLLTTLESKIKNQKTLDTISLIKNVLDTCIILPQNTIYTSFNKGLSLFFKKDQPGFMAPDIRFHNNDVPKGNILQKFNNLFN